MSHSVYPIINYWERIHHCYFMGVFDKKKKIIPPRLPRYGIILWPTVDTYRQVSNARSRGIIVDYCVFNSMQHQMDL